MFKLCARTLLKLSARFTPGYLHSFFCLGRGRTLRRLPRRASPRSLDSGPQCEHWVISHRLSTDEPRLVGVLLKCLDHHVGRSGRDGKPDRRLRGARTGELYEDQLPQGVRIPDGSEREY